MILAIFTIAILFQEPVVQGPIIESLLQKLSDRIETNQKNNLGLFARFEQRMIERFNLSDAKKEGLFARIFTKIQNLFSLIRLVLYTIILVGITVIIGYFKPMIDVFVQSAANIIKIIMKALEKFLSSLLKVNIESK